MQLARVRNEALLPDIYSDMKKASRNDIHLRRVFGGLLSNRVGAGELWAVEFLLSEKWPASDEDAYGLPISTLENLSGLGFGYDQNMWALWVKRIKGALPKFGDSKTEVLKEHMGNKDPWVRLFALKQLWNRLLLEERQVRKNMEFVTILRMTSQDEDGLVREFSTKTLEKLRKKDRER